MKIRKRNVNTNINSSDANVANVTNVDDVNKAKLDKNKKNLKFNFKSKSKFKKLPLYIRCV